MKHMKKAILLAAICCAALTGCGKSDNGAAEDTNKTEGTVTVDEPDTEAVPVETEEQPVIIKALFRIFCFNHNWYS